MSKNSKAYKAAAELVDKSRTYSPIEAAKLIKETSSKNFDSTVDVAIRLGVDPRKADQLVRGTVSLPHGTGKTARVVREMLPEAHFATVYAKPAGQPLVDTYVTEVSQDTWILFPWDTEPQFVQPIAKANGTR